MIWQAVLFEESGLGEAPSNLTEQIYFVFDGNKFVWLTPFNSANALEEEKSWTYTSAWPTVEDDVRRCLTSRFPYGVLYNIETDEVFILPVTHLHRNPDYWKYRK